MTSQLFQTPEFRKKSQFILSSLIKGFWKIWTDVPAGTALWQRDATAATCLQLFARGEGGGKGVGTPNSIHIVCLLRTYIDMYIYIYTYMYKEHTEKKRPKK